MPFKPGVSGNPGGRPAGLAEFKALCQQKTEKALKRVERIMMSKKSKDSDVIAAAEIIIERAYGKPPQEIKGVQTDPYTRAWTKILEKSGHIGSDGKVRIGSKGKGKT